MPERAGWLVIALVLDAFWSDKEWLWRQTGRPEEWCRRALAWCEPRWNRGEPQARRLGGLATVALIAGGAAAAGWLIEEIASALPFGALVEIAVVAAFLAQASTAQQIRQVAQDVADGGIAERVSPVMGEGEPLLRDESELARATIEGTALGLVTGAAAPVLAYMVFGLSGILAYTALRLTALILTREPGVGGEFRWMAENAYMVANYVPARWAALLLVGAAALDQRDWRAAWRAGRHDGPEQVSPNAGWPQGAMAGALDLRLGDPATHRHGTWLHPDGRRDCGAADIHAALRLFWLACAVQGIVAAAIWTFF
ncbi:MAG TPA: cobalamin biosynthesis protein [Alphaproteobacteria bacterium]|nr:cobalamin biosynthesis protein [Alphaproteobacteria bacterium]